MLCSLIGRDEIEIVKLGFLTVQASHLLPAISSMLFFILQFSQVRIQYHDCFCSLQSFYFIILVHNDIKLHCHKSEVNVMMYEQDKCWV